MKHYKLIVLTRAKEDQTDIFNLWYDDQHIPDVLSIPGFVAAERFNLVSDRLSPSQPWQYLAIYEIKTDDLQATLSELEARSGTDAMILSEALDLDTIYAGAFEAREDA